MSKSCRYTRSSQQKILDGGRAGVSAIGAFALLVLSVPVTGFADQSANAPGMSPGLVHPVTSANPFTKIRKAYSEVLKNSKINLLLKKGAENALSLVRHEEGLGIESTVYQHYYKGVEVMGSKAIHHLGKAGATIRNRLKDFDLAVEPTLTKEDASHLARSYTRDGALAEAPELKIMPRDDGSASLVYLVPLEEEASIEGQDVYLDAHSGRLIAAISHHQEIAPVQVFDAKGKGTLIDLSTVTPTTTVPRSVLEGCQVVDSRTGNPLIVNPRACTPVVVNGAANSSADGEAMMVRDNSQAVLNYYKNTHGRDSFDNRSSASVNVVHVGINFPNAFWNSRQNIMAYGDGDGERFGSFAVALDVAGHEMTHGVISSTAKLVYMGESGALNEAYADFFGKMIAQSAGRDALDDWTIGKKLGKSADFKGIRDLANPHNLTAQVRSAAGQPVRTIQYPASYSERQTTEAACDRSNDNCYVHINSTIPGHAAYRVLQAIGREKTQKLYYVTLTQALGETETFKSAATATLGICRQMPEFDEATCNQVKAIYAELGLVDL